MKYPTTGRSQSKRKLVIHLTLYRFELAFDGEKQHVGIFNGMECALSDMLTEHHMGIFLNLLTVPDLPPQDGPYKYWFTQDGLAHCGQALRYLLADISANGWSYLVNAVNIRPSELDNAVYYKDRYQVALKDRLLMFAEYSETREISDTAEFDLILKSLIDHPARSAHICPKCKTFFGDRPAVSREDKSNICPDCAMREALTDAHYTKEQQDEIVKIAWETRKKAHV